MLRFGLELEGFYRESGRITIPPFKMPTDGFPGIVEIRSGIHNNLYSASAEVYGLIWKLHDCFPGIIDFQINSHTFSSNDRRELTRRAARRGYIKKLSDVSSVYGRLPRASVNNKQTSLQINISFLIHDEYSNSSGIKFPARFGLFNIPSVVFALDSEFKQEIQESGRTKGLYSIKDNVRLEYRSLPSSVFANTNWIKRAEDAIKNSI